MALASLHQTTKKVCVMDASGRLGSSLVLRLLQRGYFVHATLCNDHGNLQPLKGLSSENKNLRVFQADPFDYQSIVDALKGCSALFYSFEPPEDEPTFDEFLAEVEARAAHNVLEACAQSLRQTQRAEKGSNMNRVRGLNHFLDERWTVKSIHGDDSNHDHHHHLEQQQQPPPPKLQKPTSHPSSSSSHQLIHHDNSRKLKGFNRNRRHAAYVPKTPPSQVGSSSLPLPSKEEMVEAEQTEKSGDGFSISSEVGSSSLFPSKEEEKEVVEAEQIEKSGDGFSISTRREEGFGSSETVTTSLENQTGTSESFKEVDSILGRLEKLKLVAEEPELSEKQLRINDQLQKDELLAMESIYGENIIILNREGDLRSFQMHVHVEAPNELTLSAKFHSSSGNSTFGEKAGDPMSRINSSNEFLYTFKVQYLPPVVLTCLLPKSYPSDVCPYFTISVPWLDSMRISSFCQMLDSMWMDQPGQEVIYQWVEWLHGSSLSYLGVDKELILGPYGMPDVGDRRAVSGSISPDVDIPSLMNYNDDKCHEIFRRDLHECCICFSEYAGTEFVRLPCQHFFCRKCMETYSNMHVKEGTINMLLCPDEKCGGLVPPALLKRLLGCEDFERWESLMLQKTLDSMSDVVYCPRCETACLEDEEHHAQCSKCFFSFCSLCRERRHVGVKCMKPEMSLEDLQRQSSSELSTDQRRKECEKINEMLSMMEIFRVAKQCPSCKMAISRTEGCNKMRCRNCSQYFCYRCNKGVSGTGYDHFWNGNCKFFSAAAIREWEAGLIIRQDFRRQQQAQRVEEHTHLCPICGGMNAKVKNNNHIFCRWCQRRYCYLCRNPVSNSTEHYGPKGCIQRTPG